MLLRTESPFTVGRSRGAPRKAEERSVPCVGVLPSGDGKRRQATRRHQGSSVSGRSAIVVRQFEETLMRNASLYTRASAALVSPPRSPSDVRHVALSAVGTGIAAPPPAQIPAGATNAPGSHLGCLTANRSDGHGWRTRGAGSHRFPSCVIRSNVV